MRRNYANSPSENMKYRLTQAFSDMRRAGLIARQNFSCCQSCAGYELSTMISKALDEGKKAPRGVAYYHCQDAENFRSGSDFYIAFGNVHTEKHGVVGLPDVEVGRIVVEKLRSVGLLVEWDGNGETRIKVRSERSQAEAERARQAQHAEMQREAFYASVKEVFGL